MRHPPPLLRFFLFFVRVCGQGQFKECSIIRWAEVKSKGYVVSEIEEGGTCPPLTPHPSACLCGYLGDWGQE